MEWGLTTPWWFVEVLTGDGRTPTELVMFYQHLKIMHPYEGMLKLPHTFKTDVLLILSRLSLHQNSRIFKHRSNTSFVNIQISICISIFCISIFLSQIDGQIVKQLSEYINHQTTSYHLFIKLVFSVTEIFKTNH